MKVKELRKRLKVFKNQYGDEMRVVFSFKDKTGMSFNLPIDRVVVERLERQTEPVLIFTIDFTVKSCELW